MSKTYNGGMTVGTILTMIETGKKNVTDPYFYLKYLMVKMLERFCSVRADEGIEQVVL